MLPDEIFERNQPNLILLNPLQLSRTYSLPNSGKEKVMSSVGLESLDHTVELTHIWINELDDRLGWNNKPKILSPA